METTTLGRTGLKVSKLGLGGAPLAGDFYEVDEREIHSMIHEAIDLGISFIDTAPLYGNGTSEERLGRALKGRRDRVVLATKAARSDQVYDRRTIVRSVEESLGRLQTDYVDLLQLHDVEHQSFETVMEEAVPALERLRAEGKLRHIGVTTRNLPLLLRYMRTGKFDTIQFYARYMLIDHTAKDEVLPLAAELELGVINGSVLGLGMLADAPASFLIGTGVAERAAERMSQLDFLREAYGGSLIEPGMRFSLSNPGIDVTLTGAASREVIRQNASFCDGKGLSPDEQSRVLALFDRQPLFRK